MKKNVFLITMQILFLCLPAYPLENSKWKSIGPYGGSIEGLAVNPLNPNECFAIGNTSWGYIYWSKNGGKSWLYLYGFYDRVYDISVDPVTPEIIYVMGYYNLHKSVDKGKTWQKKPFGYGVVTKNSQVALNPMSPNKIYVVGKDKADFQKACILRSSDAAESWTRQVIHTAPSTIIGNDIAISPSNPDVLYASIYYIDSSSYSYKSRIFKSSNGGHTWTKLPGEISNAVNAIAIDPFNPDKIYLGTNWQVTRSSDGGQTWEESDDYVYSKSLAIDRNDPDILYSGYDNCCYRSEDGGIHWEKYRCNDLGSCKDLLLLGGKLLYASDVGIYASSDGAENWENSHDGISKVCIKAVSITKTFPTKIYALPVDGEKLYVSEDFGITWSCSEGLASCGILTWIESHPHNPEKAFIATSGGG